MVHIRQPCFRFRFRSESLSDNLHPQVGSLPKNDIDVGTGLVGAPAYVLSFRSAPVVVGLLIAVARSRCGDVMKLQIRVDEEGIISDVKFKTFGCGSAIASSSYMTERVKGLSLEEAGKIKNTEIAKELCLPPVKLHCSSAYFPTNPSLPSLVADWDLLACSVS